MTDVICLGLAVVDIFLSLVPKDIMEKDAVRINDIGMCAGGDAVNQTVMLSRLGMSTSLLAKTGDDDMGHFIASAIKKAGGDDSLMICSKSTSTATAAALIDGNGERHILSKKGSNADLCFGDLKETELDAKALSVASFFGLPSLEADGGMLEVLKRAKGKGMITFADMANDKLGQRLSGIKSFLPYIDHFMPSQKDAENLCGRADENVCADMFLEAGCRNVIIKKGAEGVFFKNKTQAFDIPAFDVRAKDTTGAGDTFCAAYIASLLRGYEIKDALTYACCAAAYAIQFFGASTAPITHEKVIQKLKSNL